MELSLIPSPTVIDPVCGMSVDPESSKPSFSYQGKSYHFCSAGCLSRFQQEPGKYLAGHREPMMPAAPAGTRYICPMDPEVVSDRPGPCPKCGMAL